MPVILSQKAEGEARHGGSIPALGRQAELCKFQVSQSNTVLSQNKNKNKIDYNKKYKEERWDGSVGKGPRCQA